MTNPKAARRRSAPRPETPNTDVPPADATGTGGQLTRVTVNLTHRATQALEKASRETGDSKTDTINRSVQAYSLFLDLARRGGGSIRVIHDDNTIERIYLL